MKAFFRRLELQTNKREGMVKESLTSQLLSSIKDVQLDHAHAEDKETAQQNNEATNFLCTVLEAIFIHGLKETLADRVSLAIANPDQRPEPEFWSPLLVYSHKDVIKQILIMSQITTDVGRCRAWIRLALNDCLLMSYLEAISQQNKALNPYYKKSAYLRDTEVLLVARNALEGLMSIPFALPTNSSIFNVWTNTPLLLAGIWTPPMKLFPVFTATDVAKTLSVGEKSNTDNEDTQSLLSLASYQESLFGSERFTMSEDEALKIILGTPVEGSPLQSKLNLSHDPETGRTSSAMSIDNEPVLASSLESTSTGNEIEKTTTSEPVSSSEPDEKEIQSECTKEVTIPEADSTPKEPPKNINTQTYQNLLKNYTPTTNLSYKPPDLQDFLQRFESFPTKSPSPDSSGSDDAVTRMGYEIVNESPLTIKAPEFRNMVEHLSRIMQEPGLDSQNYTCLDCCQPIGISFNKPRLCALTGSYYCSDCFSSTEWIIPARILQNWDFSRYEVCGKAGIFLSEVQYHPLLDVRRINPKLYLAINEMAVIQKLRLKLNLLHGYLMTCREPVMKKLQKQVWPREYLYEHVHLYSISDLVEIPNGILVQFLQTIIEFSQDHVLTCCLCSQKGFICEICKDKSVIYPFEIDTSFRCLLCKGVFHKTCKEKQESCPKCRRKKMREMELDKCEEITC